MRCDDMEPGGQAETNARQERITEAHAGKIQVGVCAHKCLYLIVRCNEAGESLSEGR